MKKYLKVLTASSILLLGTGCGADNNNNGNNGNGQANINTADRDNNNYVELNGRNNNQTTNNRRNNNRTMDVADGVADRIAVMDEVDHANVIVTGNTAYVSVRLNNAADKKSTNQNSGTKRSSGNPTGIINQNGRGNATGTPSADFDNEAPNTNKNRNAVNINNGNTISSDLERRITQRVKAYDNRIQNVNVSTDENFYNNMNDYSDRIRNGNNNANMINDFNDTVRRIFPDNNNR